jgi:hypothetical protein
MKKYMLVIVALFLLFSLLWSSPQPRSQISRTINSLPYIQNFEGTVFPPTDWTSYDVDGEGQQWSANSTYNHSPGGSRSVMH